MSETPVSPGLGRDANPPGEPAVPGDHPWLGSPDWTPVPDSPERPAWQDEAFWAGEEYPGDLDEYEDPDNAPPRGLDDAQLAALIAEAREITEEQARAAEEAARLGHTAVLAALGAVAAGRRGPGMPGSAQSFPGEYSSRAAGFASGKPLDVAPGCLVLGQFAEEAAGDDDRYQGASDDELLGAVGAWDRVEAHVAARKHAAIAELVRRRPAAGAPVDAATEMPEGWDEFTPRELGAVLGQSPGDAEDMLDLAAALEIDLPGTKAALSDGIIDRAKALIIVAATGFCDPAEARAAEALVLGRAGSLTAAGLRAAIRRAVMEVAPDKAAKRREHAAKQARVERWTEGSGNAGLAGRELAPAQVLAADQRITWWARQLREAGLDGGMDLLRARAMMDILLGTDSRPPASAADGGPHDGGPDPDGPPQPPFPDPAGPLSGIIPPGFAGRVTLTVPLATATGRADRPGELAGLWPIDPALARDLVAAAARSPGSAWCVTVTDGEGHAIGHGCARPEPASHTKRGKRGPPGGGPGPPLPPDRGGPRFTFTPTGQPGPPGGYGTWRLSTGIPGQRDLLVGIDPIPTGHCDHRFQAAGHDPGVKLRHLAQVQHATCTGPGCRRPSSQADFEHNTAYNAGGRTCLCQCDPKCRFDHRMKQDLRWRSEKLPSGHVRWTMPSGRQHTTEPTRYPI